MSIRDQLNSYIQQLERRLRLGALRIPHFLLLRRLRGAERRLQQANAGEGARNQ